MLPGDAAPIGRVTSLNVWVDGHGVIRRMHLTSHLRITTPNRAEYLIVGKNGHLKRIKLGRRVPVRHGIERASAWVSFLDIGQPQTSTAPAHAVPVRSRG